ncbi:MAG: HigA family addiction module antidote protein [Treponema sp.]|jgi:addiction module HigA family antidote|nr:HigA family addiction module antidote protein [Treponema sp.]
MAKKQTLLVPGEELKKLLDEYNIHISTLAGDIGLSVSAIRQIVANKAKVSLHIAKRLAKYFNETTVDYWVAMQNAYDLAELDRDPEFIETLKNIPKAKKVPDPSSAKGKKSPEKSSAKTAQGRSKKSAPVPSKPPRKPRPKKAASEDTAE